MSGSESPNLLLRRADDSVVSTWTTRMGELHFTNYGFDDYGTEVIHIDGEYGHRDDIMDLDWERTHRTWTGDSWKIDFDALDRVAKHLIEHDYEITVNTQHSGYTYLTMMPHFLQLIFPTSRHRNTR